jgi:hypothetical protein
MKHKFTIELENILSELADRIRNLKRKEKAIPLKDIRKLEATQLMSKKRRVISAHKAFTAILNDMLKAEEVIENIENNISNGGGSVLENPDIIENQDHFKEWSSEESDEESIPMGMKIQQEDGSSISITSKEQLYSFFDKEYEKFIEKKDKLIPIKSDFEINDENKIDEKLKVSEDISNSVDALLDSL